MHKKGLKTKKEVVRVEGKLKEIVTVKDSKGNILHKIMNPLRVEFHAKDFVQVIVGASILAIPVGFTEETWKLGEMLPVAHVLGFLLLSLLFISVFVYFFSYRNRMKDHWTGFLKRITVTYLVSFLVVGLLLSLIQKAPWTTDWLLAFKRVVLVTFPASMSAAVVDTIK